MRKIYFILSIVLVTAFIAGCGGGGDKGGAKTAPKKVILTDAGWDSIRVYNSIVKIIADKGYGMTTEVVTGSTPITHTALVRGDIDVNLETWSSNIASYDADVKSGAIVQLGINFDDNVQGLFVPKYVIEGDAARGIKAMAPDLKTVEDLKKYPQLFKDEENPSKGRIYGAIPGWAADAILSEKVKAYKLDETFNYFRPGSDATMYASFVTSIERGAPIVGYLWSPTWITGKYEFIVLEDKPYTNDADFKKGLTAFPSVPVTVCASKKFAESAPEFVEFLKKFKTSSAFAAEALAYMSDNKASYDDVAVYMLKKHDSMIDSWLPADKAKAVRESLKK